MKTIVLTLGSSSPHGSPQELRSIQNSSPVSASTPQPTIEMMWLIALPLLEKMPPVYSSILSVASMPHEIGPRDHEGRTH